MKLIGGLELPLTLTREGAMKNTILVTLMVALIATPCFAQETSTLSVELQEALDKTREELGIVGISAAVIKPGNDLWFGVSGLAQKKPPQDLETEMLFCIGGVTKTLTAALVLQLAEEGLLSLDDTVGDWLSDLPKRSTRRIDDSITIENLLRHTSGLNEFLNFPPRLTEIIAFLLAPRKIWDPEDTLRFLRRPFFAPGEGYHYSNMNYILLGMIIERATNSNVAVEFRNRFFYPLGLKNTFMSIEEPLDGKLANAHLLGNDFSRIPREALDSAGWTAFSIFSTAEDIARWTEALFGGSLLSKEYLDKMLEFINVEGEVFWDVEGKEGLGIWFVEHPQFGEMWFCRGTWPCYSSFMGYLPDDEIVFVVLMNEYFTDSFAVVDKLLEAAVH